MDESITKHTFIINNTRWHTSAHEDCERCTDETTQQRRLMAALTDTYIYLHIIYYVTKAYLTRQTTKKRKPEKESGLLWFLFANTKHILR